MKYSEWLDEWLVDYIRPTVKSKTFERYESIVKTQLNKIGEIEIGDLTSVLLQRFVTELLTVGNNVTGDGLSANSVNGIITVIKSSLRTAFNIGLIDTYSAANIVRPKVTEKQVCAFNSSERSKIETACINGKKRKHYGILLCMYTGMRIGELLALKWEDIDFSDRTITVNKTCHDGKGKSSKYERIIDAPKTAMSRRLIPIPKQLLFLLKEWKRADKCEYVVSSKNKPIGIRSYQRSFERLLKKLNISRKGFHALRHTFATMALECGMDVKTLSEILGHKNPTVTLNRYVHSFMEHKRDMMDRLGRKSALA